MKQLMAKIWVPTLLVLLAGVQSFGIDIHRASTTLNTLDTLEHTTTSDTNDVALANVDTIKKPDSLALDTLRLDTLRTDSLVLDSLGLDSTKIITAKDSIQIPDSLKETDPFFYKYYIAVKDSLTRMQVRDSLLTAGDTLELMKLDSLYIKDSTETAIAEFNEWYSSLSRRERKKYDIEQALPGMIAATLRKMEVKDSIKAHKDSVRASIPRILDTYAFPDSMQYKRIVTWKHDRYFNDIEDLRDQTPDSSYNHNFYDLPFQKQDVNATWLGVSGSPVQMYDFFKQEAIDNAIFYTPYSSYSYTAESLPQYNTKTPYTELAYYGTLFSTKIKEETNIRILTTQNITPELNLTLQYQRFGAEGMLQNEATDYRNAVIATNYTGKKYLMHAGFIYDRIERKENGGIIDTKWIRDTTVDSKEIDVYLKKASNSLRRNTVFLDQSLRIPFTFLDKEYRAQKKEEKRLNFLRDSIMSYGDSTAIALFRKDSIAREEAKIAAGDSVKLENRDVTTAFVGHSSEYSVYRKTYEDNISDNAGKEFYNNKFYLHPSQSMDSMRVMKFENRVYLRLQPWKSDGIVSKLDVGIGDKLTNYYSFHPKDYIQGGHNVSMNSAYVYAGAQGQYKKYFEWNAIGKYNFLGYEVNDFLIGGNLTFKAYPFRKDRKSPLILNAHVETSLKEPDFYQQYIITNHYKWDNDFSKTSTTKLEAELSIPRWKLDASFGYSLLSNNIYYDTLGIVRQNSTPMSVIKASLRKDFQLWKFHFDNKLLFQLSSNQEVMPLPLLALKLRYYLEFDVVRDAMKMQIGANGTFTTNWYAPAYNPVLGVFHNQNKEQFGNCPYIDLFVNVQWKRVSVFMKVVNINMGWPSEKADYFTAAGYIASPTVFKIGVTWPFYVLPGKKSTSVNGGRAAGGGVGANSGRPSSTGNGRSGMRTVGR